MDGGWKPNIIRKPFSLESQTPQAPPSVRLIKIGNKLYQFVPPAAVPQNKPTAVDAAGFAATARPVSVAIGQHSNSQQLMVQPTSAVTHVVPIPGVVTATKAIARPTSVHTSPVSLGLPIHGIVTASEAIAQPTSSTSSIVRGATSERGSSQSAVIGNKRLIPAAISPAVTQPTHVAPSIAQNLYTHQLRVQSSSAVHKLPIIPGARTAPKAVSQLISVSSSSVHGSANSSQRVSQPAAISRAVVQPTHVASSIVQGANAQQGSAAQPFAVLQSSQPGPNTQQGSVAQPFAVVQSSQPGPSSGAMESYSPSSPGLNVDDWDLDGSQVKVFGLPFGITEDALLDLVNQTIIQLGLSSKEEAYRCNFVNEGSVYWAVLHFVSITEASYCSALDGMKYNGSSLRFKIQNSLTFEDSPSSSKPVTPENSSLHFKDRVPSSMHPGEDDASCIFVRSMLNHRYMRGKQICVDYQKMWLELLQHNVEMSLYQIKERKRSLLVYYQSIKGKPQESKWKHTETIKAFLSAAEIPPRWEDEGWKVPETLSLIDEYVARIPIFDCSTVRHDTAWAEIVLALRVSFPERSQKFTHASVHSKWDRLLSFYNKIEDTLKRTGESSQLKAWIFYDAMSLHFHDRVTSNPEFTMSAGVQSSVHKRSREEGEQEPQSKKPRLSYALRKMDLEARRLETNEAIAQAFLRIADRIDKIDKKK